MANGDSAAAAGLPVVPASKDIRLGYDDINNLADAVAAHMVSGGHAWDKVTGKPATYPPSAHEHAVPNASAIYSAGLGFATNVDAALAHLLARITVLEGK